MAGDADGLHVVFPEHLKASSLPADLRKPRDRLFETSRGTVSHEFIYTRLGSQRGAIHANRL